MKKSRHAPQRLAVLADIHSNLPALERVVEHIEGWDPELVIVGGDIINRGPSPQECLAIILEKQAQEGWQLVRGNHEDYVLAVRQPEYPQEGPEFEISRNGFWTYEQLQGQVDPLETMPFQVSQVGPEGGEVRVVHASMRHNRDGIFPKTTDEELRDMIEPPPTVLCVGHTHRPLKRLIDETLVVNVGSVGCPFDGDPRAAYTQLVWLDGRWQVDLIRLTYDRQRTERLFFENGFIPGAGPLGELMLYEFHQAKAHIHLWFAAYGEAVLAGEITVREAVDAYLEKFPDHVHRLN